MVKKNVEFICDDKKIEEFEIFKTSKTEFSSCWILRTAINITNKIEIKLLNSPVKNLKDKTNLPFDYNSKTLIDSAKIIFVKKDNSFVKESHIINFENKYNEEKINDIFNQEKNKVKEISELEPGNLFILQEDNYLNLIDFEENFINEKYEICEQKLDKILENFNTLIENYPKKINMMTSFKNYYELL